MRRQRRGRSVLVVAALLGAAAHVSALPVDVEAGDAAFQVAAAFESVPDENSTALLDEVVMPASLESQRAVPSPPDEDSEPRDLRPVEVSTEKHHHSSSLPVPYGGAMVAVEAAALLVGGATLIVLLIVKAKARSAVTQYEYDEDYIDPMLQSLLYSDMDYAAI
ncbi:uncharacterized protein IUM83_13731 [Phytophthora cinnamomi]|uniref:uncharacterized protein n=1 Tax=Phytophthora cinnamomi TaxID=4785 RepID=UPI00355A863C|nr:hypothetical protein IUM83_13731 [Phytophthora cinnamomi]